MINDLFDKSKFDLLNISEYDYCKFNELYLHDIPEDEREDYNSMFNYLENLNNAILIEDIYVKDEFKNQGLCKEVVAYLKSLGKTLILYTVADSETYWMLQHGFENIDTYVYRWN